MRAGVVQLSRWGLLGAIVDAGTPAVRTTTFTYGGGSVAIPVKPFGVTSQPTRALNARAPSASKT